MSGTQPTAFRASKAKPCPVCRTGTKGCSVLADGLHLCRGEPTDPAAWKCVKRGDPFNSYRRADDTRHLRNGSAPVRPVRASTPPPRDWPAEAERYAAALTPGRHTGLAKALGLPVSALAALPLLGWIADHRVNSAPKGKPPVWIDAPCWTFPQHDAAGRIIGITRRFRQPVVIDGGDPTNKAAMGGGKQGLYIPEGWREKPGPVFLPEGASDVLALTAAGIAAVGRPSDKGGVELLADLLADLPPGREIIVLGENDARPSKTNPGETEWPGRKGAEYVRGGLGGKLCRAVRTAYPPDGIKDTRDWVQDLAAGQAEAEDWPAIGRAILAHCMAQAEAAATPPGAARLVSRSLAEVETRPVEWLWPGRVPFGMLSILDGDPSRGKSLITIDIAARLSRGNPMPFCAVPTSGPRGTLIVAAEDTAEHVIKPRATVAGADLGLVWVCETIRIGENERPIRFPDDFDLLEREIKDRKAGHVIIDPVLGFLSQSIDSHKDQSVRDVLHHLKLIAERTGAAIVGLRHLNKAGSGNALYRGIGSIAITAAARSALVVDAHPTDGGVQILATAKCNLGALPRSITYRITETAGYPVISWGDECDLTANDLGVRGAGRPDRTRDDAVKFLRDLLAGGPVPAAEGEARAAEARISLSTLGRARKVLGVRCRKTGFASSSWVWELPDSHAEGAQNSPAG